MTPYDKTLEPPEPKKPDDWLEREDIEYEDYEDRRMEDEQD
ncbi:hypothetical protein [Pediococcus claussenii]|nr:hypothetical protein [Pediococcus claussenii]